MDAGEIRVKLTLDSAGLKTGIDNAKASLTNWRDGTLESTRETMKWGAALTATVAPVLAVGAAVYSTVESFGAMADQIQDLSYTTGLSTDRIQQLQYAAVLSGTEFSSVSTGINNFTLAISKASDASSDAGKAFAALNVKTDGRTNDQIFEDTAKALVTMRNETERNEIAATLYGRSWKEMLPYLQTYIDKAEEIRENPVLSEAELKDLEDAKIQIDALGSKLTILEGKWVTAGVDSWNKSIAGLHIVTAIQTLDLQGLNKALEENNRLYSQKDTFDPAEFTKRTGATYSPTVLGRPDSVKKTSELKDIFKDLTGEELRLAKMEQDLIDVNEDVQDAFERGDVAAFNAATYKAAVLREEISNLRKSLSELKVEIKNMPSSISSGGYTDSEGNFTATSSPDYAGLNNFSQMSYDQLKSYKDSYKGGSKNVNEKLDYWLGQKGGSSGSSEVTVRVVAEEGTLAKKVGQQGA